MNAKEKAYSINGRIIYIDAECVYISEESKTYKLKIINKLNNYKIGDIVSVKFIEKSGDFVLNDIILLNSPVNNPLLNNKSSFYILNKDNKKMVEILYKRQSFFYETRKFFINKGFLEIHSPTLVASPGVESHLEPFVTEYFDYKKNKKRYYLPTSPEFSLKKALSAGLESIFEISKSFRNFGEASNLHRPEFFLLEWYRAFYGYYKIMDDVYDYIIYLSENIYNKDYIIYKNDKCNLGNLKKKKLKELFNEFNIDLDNYMINEKKFINDIVHILKLDKKALDLLTKEDLFFKFIINKVEPLLGFKEPVILYEYPIDMCVLTRECNDNPLYGERFELYMFGIEIANAYGELTDPVEQEKRFNKILSFRKKESIFKLKMPVKFLDVLKYGLPPCSGIALGLERLFMLFENLESINDTNLFDF